MWILVWEIKTYSLSNPQKTQEDLILTPKQEVGFVTIFFNYVTFGVILYQNLSKFCKLLAMTFLVIRTGGTKI